MAVFIQRRQFACLRATKREEPLRHKACPRLITPCHVVMPGDRTRAEQGRGLRSAPA